MTRNLAWARDRSLPLANPAELVTGEHSGLANARPGNPGTIDPPTIDDVEPLATGGTLPAGTYEYAVTARSPAGETVASTVPGIVVVANGSVRVSFNAVCHAVGYDVYRRPTAGAWSRVGTLPWSATAATDDGEDPIVLSVTDTAAAGTAAAPPAVNGAALAPYGQNPAFLNAITAAGVGSVASDASKGYPSEPTVVTSTLLSPGASFVQGAVRAVPRYPSNVYYNVSRQGQQLDEYNWIYVAPEAGGGCVPIAGVTTCRTVPATWAEYVTSETRVMFRHLTGNDPRPHYFHQSNLADYNPALPDTHPDQGGILYPVIDALVGRYETGFDRAAAPLLQLTQTQAGETLARQDAWARAAASVSGWLQDGRVYVRNSEPRGGRRAAHGHDGGRPLRRSAVGVGDGGARRDHRLRAIRPDADECPCRDGNRPRGRDAHGLGRIVDRHGPDLARVAVAALRRTLHQRRRCTQRNVRAHAGRRGPHPARRRARRQLDLVGEPGLLDADARRRPAAGGATT